MGQRVGRGPFPGLRERVDARRDGRPAELYALRRARRPGRVEDHGDVVRRRLGDVAPVGLPDSVGCRVEHAQAGRLRFHRPDPGIGVRVGEHVRQLVRPGVLRHGHDGYAGGQRPDDRDDGVERGLGQNGEPAYACGTQRLRKPTAAPTQLRERQ